MRYRCKILNHGIHGYEVWLHGRNQGRPGLNSSNIEGNDCRSASDLIPVDATYCSG